MSHFELWMTDDSGVRISDLNGNSPLSRIMRFTATRVANGIGKIVIDVSGDFDQSLLRVDNMIQLWHAPAGQSLRLWRIYFLRGWRYTMTAGGGTTLQLTGCCTNDLLRRRVVANVTDSPECKMDDFSDDMLRQVMRDATEAITDPLRWFIGAGPSTRNWSLFSVEADAGRGPDFDFRDMCFRQLLDTSGGGVLPDICKASRDNDGVELFFDVVPLTVSSSGITLVFRAYRELIGADRTLSGITFDPELGNLTDVELEFDYAEEINDSYTGNIGSHSGANIRETYNSGRYYQSIWNSCEGYVSGGVNDGIAQIRDSRTTRFIATAVQTDSAVFGRDWDWGDKVRARFKQFAFDTIIRAVTVQVDDQGKETVSARIDETEE